MNLLAIETSTDACSIALRVGTETLVDHRVEPRRHAQLVLPMIDALLAEAALPRTALDGVVYGRGPGSFTGVRVAASVTQGIAFGLDIGVIGVSTLATIAEGCRREFGDARVGVALDARLDEIYWGAFRVVDGVMNACVDERVCPADAAVFGAHTAGVTQAARHGNDTDWCLAGAGAERYVDTLRAALALADDAPLRAACLPRASDALVLARPLIDARGLLAPETAVPLYLRERVALTEAERRGEPTR